MCQGAAAGGDVCGEARHGPRRPHTGCLLPGVGGVPGPSALPAQPVQVHTRQSGQQEGPHRVPGEAPGAEPTTHGQASQDCRQAGEETQDSHGGVPGPRRIAHRQPPRFRQPGRDSHARALHLRVPQTDGDRSNPAETRHHFGGRSQTDGEREGATETLRITTTRFGGLKRPAKSAAAKRYQGAKHGSHYAFGKSHRDYSTYYTTYYYYF
ncbi:hypothetical protein GWK47_041766 [Chionoecetes opilio]|uniref:Uncharacterized protein n=1 Tax=Chionoecetes opilio TaxID=41210 RepID=A0A8J4YIQ7_CHIOP|nr:hypothetical protein GWK47_041766 [Chionoecetes opilio]